MSDLNKLESLTREIRALVVANVTAERREKNLQQANLKLNELLGLIQKLKKGAR